MSTPRKSEPPSPHADWAFFLDVDGTLINLADTPQAVCVDAALLDLIGRLHRASGGAVALVSGRMISDLQSRLGALTLPLAGQHGLERRDAAGRLWMHAAPPAAKYAIKESLAQLLCPRHPGLLRRQPVILLDDPAPGLGEADGLRLRRAQHGSQQARAEQLDEP